MSDPILDVVVVGAGLAGLSASYFLKKAGSNHIVLERGRIGASWRQQRWDSFLLNTTHKMNVLPGHTDINPDPEVFDSAADFTRSLEEYVSTFQLPVVEDTTVVSVEKPSATGIFAVTVSQNNNLHVYYSRKVIIASGVANESRIPVLTRDIPPSVVQLHTGDYRRPGQLPAGKVLVVGSGQSGCQIADDLIMAGRQVFLSTSMVPRLPRRYRGKDIYDWLILMGTFDVRKEDIKDPAQLKVKTPQLTGAGGGSKTISLQALAKKGVQLLGKLTRAEGQALFFQPDAHVHVKFADDFSANAKKGIDGYILDKGLTAPAPTMDEEDMPDTMITPSPEIEQLSIEKEHISAIIWATGFGGKFDYIKLPVLGKSGMPEHTNGSSSVEGLFFLGLPWLRRRGSVLLKGISEDAAFISSKVCGTG